MTEDFLHYAWRYQHFQATQLQTTQGQSLAVLSVGELNRNAGPDFLNARLHIEDTLWAGNVEIHLKSSDWLLHHHQQDPAYNNVVLHVVLDEDVPIQRDPYQGDEWMLFPLAIRPVLPCRVVRPCPTSHVASDHLGTISHLQQRHCYNEASP